MTRYLIAQLVEARSLEDAETVAAERLGHDEDYGFPYRWAGLTVSVAEPLPALLDAAPLLPPEGVELSTAAQFAAWWNAQDEAAREDAFARIREWSKASADCFIRNHAGLASRVEELRGVLEVAEQRLARHLAECDVSRETSEPDGTLTSSLVQLGTRVIASPLGDSTLPRVVGDFVTVDAEGVITLDVGAPTPTRIHSADYRLHLIPKGRTS